MVTTCTTCGGVKGGPGISPFTKLCTCPLPAPPPTYPPAAERLPLRALQHISAGGVAVRYEFHDASRGSEEQHFRLAEETYELSTHASLQDPARRRLLLSVPLPDDVDHQELLVAIGQVLHAAYSRQKGVFVEVTGG